MSPIPRRLLSFAIVLVVASAAGAEDWRQWRGPTGDNHAPAGATAPERWSPDEGLAWKTKLPPGAGHSSPTLVGDRIYLTTGDPDAGTQSLLILSRSTGELLKTVVVHRGGLAERIHSSNTHASPTVASDSQRVFALFDNQNSAVVTAFTLDGEQLWQRRMGGFDPQQFQFGFGSSPRLAGGVLVVATEYDGPESGLYAVDPATGEPVWDTERPEGLSYSSPAVATLGGVTQLLMTGNQRVASYEASSGDELWSVDGSTRATCGTMVWDEGLGLAFGSGGFPEPFTLAVKTDGSHDIVWQNTTKCYEQSMLLVDGYLYAVADSGVAHCFNASHGEEMWKERLGGRYSSSPLLVDGKVYVTSEEGTMRVFRATPEQFELISVNQMGDYGFATPTPADGRLYHRFAVNENGGRQEYLAAIGE